MSDEWHCPVCTFYHAFTGARCSMCNSLRVSKQEMRDFIAGKTIQNAATPCSRDEPSDATKGISIGGKSIVQNGNSNQISMPVKDSSIASCRVQQGNGKNTSGDQRPDQSTTSTTSRQIISTSTKSSHRTIANPYMKNPYSTSNIVHENRSGLDLQHSSNQTMLQDPNPDMARSKAHPPPVSRQANAPISGGVRLNQHRKERQSRMINPYAKNAASSLQETATSTNNTPRNNSSQNKATAINGNGNQRPHNLHTGVRPVSNINEMRSISDRNVNVGRRTIREPIVANPFAANATNTVTAKDDNTKRLQARSINNSGNSQTSQVQQVASHPIISDPSQQRLQNMGFQGQNSANNANVVERNFVLRGYQPGRVPLVPGELQKTWIYPKGDKFGEREYQLAISRSAILHNTLVSLPTGLGKTLIAAVVMYNFYRWFPTGKVVFLAPTRPLVRQQIEACYNIMGIPELHTAEISGSVKDRERLWRTRRVFFCTPQAFERDIENGLCDINLVVCLVLDEAHKTTKKYAYNVVVQRLRNAKVNARIVGLSATPGRDLKGIQEVIDNLGVSKIEARLDSDPEVKPYVHNRSFEIIRVEPCTAETEIEKLLNNILNPLIAMLRERNGLSKFRGANSAVSSFHIFQAQQEHREQNNFSLVQQFSTAKALLSAREALGQNGIKMARNKISTFMEQYAGKGNYIGFVLQSAPFMDLWSTLVKLQDTGKSFSQDNAEDLKLNNPKLDKLEFVLKEHFERAKACNESSRAIVFSQFRESVEEIVGVLSMSAPLLKATKFVGQGTGTTIEDSSTPNTKRTTTTRVAGMNQKEQQQVIRDFRDGKHNILVCTSIGEEGLDIGQVDLIVNFDCLRSPIRMVQRTGRTGRKRDGRVVCLLSKGREEIKLQKAEADTKLLWNALKNSRAFNFTKNVPLLPVQPILIRMNMNVVRDYRLSQIGGHSQKHEGRKKIKNVSAYDCNAWRLSDAKELDRRELFGNYAQNPTFVRNVIKAWQNGLPSNKSVLFKRPLASRGVGQSSLVLRDVESIVIIAEAMQESKNENEYTSSACCEDKLDKRDLFASFSKCQREPSTTSFCKSVYESDEDNGVAIFSPPDVDYCEDSEPNSAILRTASNLDDIFGPLLMQNTSQLCRNSFNIIFGDNRHDCCVEPPSGVINHILQSDNDLPSSVCSPEVSILHHWTTDKETPSSIFAIDSTPEKSLNNEMSHKEDESSLQPSFHPEKASMRQHIMCEVGMLADTMRESPSTSSRLDASSTTTDLVLHLSSVPNEDDEQTSTAVQLSSVEMRLRHDRVPLDQDPRHSSEIDTHANTTKTCANGGTSRDDNSICFDLPSQDSSSSSSDDTGEPENGKGAYQNVFTHVEPNNPKTIHVDVNSEDSKTMSYDGTARIDLKASNEFFQDETILDSVSRMRSPSRLRLRPTSRVAHETEGAQLSDQDSRDEGKLLLPKRKTTEAIVTDQFSSSQDEAPFINRKSKSTVDPFLSQFSTPGSKPNIHTPCDKRGSAIYSSNIGLVNDLTDTPVSGKRKTIRNESEMKIIDSSSILSADMVRFDHEDSPLAPASTKRKLDNSMSSHDLEEAKQRKVEKLAKLRKKLKGKCKFLDVEAEASTADSGDEDSDDNLLSQDSFINNSSQLGFTDDVLDMLDCNKLQSSSPHDLGMLHRQVHMMKEQDETFATPVLKRRRKGNNELSLQSSEKKLGGMHFIRSVIEHHRKGGDANELERGYHEIIGRDERADTQDSETRSVHDTQEAKNPAQILPTSSTTVPQRPPVSPIRLSTLTAAQLERMRINKERAILLRQNKLSKL